MTDKNESRTGSVLDRNAEYEQFRLKWMLSHGYSISDLISSMQTMWLDSDRQPDISTLFSEWELSSGFNGVLWPCYEEWKTCEGKYLDNTADLAERLCVFWSDYDPYDYSDMKEVSETAGEADLRIIRECQQAISSPIGINRVLAKLAEAADTLSSADPLMDRCMRLIGDLARLYLERPVCNESRKQRYNVNIHYEGGWQFCVVADSEEEAKAKAEELFEDLPAKDLINNLADSFVDDCYPVGGEEDAE